MNIALIVEHADANHGGAERYTVQLATALCDRGHHVTLLSTTGAEPPKGVELVTFSARGLGRTQRYANYLRLLDRHFSVHKYDIIHAMCAVHDCDIYHPHAGLAAEAMARGHLKHASSLRQHLSHAANQVHMRRRYFLSVERKLLRRPNLPVVLCVSDFVKAEVRRHYPLPEDHLVTLFNAVNLERFNPVDAKDAGVEVRKRHGISPDKTVALMIAQNFRLKGLAETIDAVSKLNDPRLVLLVVGKESTAAYGRQSRELGIQNQIIFAGPTTDARSYYAAADFFILPTRRDSCSLVVLEALAMGVPVISTMTNGACEIMRDGHQGFVLPDPRDIDAIVEALRKMMDVDFRRSCSEASLALRDRLSFSHHVHQMEKLYASLQ